MKVARIGLGEGSPSRDCKSTHRSETTRSSLRAIVRSWRSDLGGNRPVREAAAIAPIHFRALWQNRSMALAARKSWNRASRSRTSGLVSEMPSRPVSCLTRWSNRSNVIPSVAPGKWIRPGSRTPMRAAITDLQPLKNISPCQCITPRDGRGLAPDPRWTRLARLLQPWGRRPAPAPPRGRCTRGRGNRSGGPLGLVPPRGQHDLRHAGQVARDDAWRQPLFASGFRGGIVAAMDVQTRSPQCAGGTRISIPLVESPGRRRLRSGQGRPIAEGR